MILVTVSIYMICNLGRVKIQIDWVLQTCTDDKLSVAVPMRMLEVFSAEKTYLPVLQDANCVASLIEQVLHYVVHKGYYRTLYILVNHKLPSCLEYCDAPHVPYASALLEHVLKPLHFTYSSCSQGARQYVFAGFMEEFISSPFTDQIFHFFIPALADARCSFPFEPFLHLELKVHEARPSASSDADGGCSPVATAQGSGTAARSHAEGKQAERAQAAWGQPAKTQPVTTLGTGTPGLAAGCSLSEEGLLLYLRTLQTLLPQLPMSVTSTSRQEVISDSDDDEEDGGMKTVSSQEDRKISVQFITEQCIHKLDTKQQTNALLNLVWRDCASEDVFTMMASICHTLMVQHRMMVPKVRSMVPLLHVISRGSPMSPEDSNRLIPLFYLFSSLFSHSLISIHDSEFFGIPTEGQCQSSMMPFTLLELVSLSRCLRDACLGIIQLAYPETKPEHREEYIAAFKSVGVKTNTEIQQRIQAEQKQWIQLFKVITNLVKMLKARDIRRHFCPSEHWLSQEVNIRADKVTQLYVPSARHVWRIRRMGRIGPLQSTLDVGMEPPQLSVSEERQLAILTELPFVVPFEERVKIFQRLIYADKRDIQGDGPFLDGINVTIRRNYIYEDAYDKLSPENGLLQYIIFTFYDSPAQLLYLILFKVKALYENMLVELPFASFFLSKLLGTSADVDIHHLASLDPEMYRNLLFLKSYEEDVEDLGLNFTVVNNDLGEAQVVELKLGGKDITVTTANRIAYIHLVADYRLNKQIRPHCLAFRQGLANVVNLEWLRMFDQQELQILISGAHIPISLDDLKKFTNYSGGYSATHPVIKIFWEVVESFTDEEKRKLLKFVTSCSRPPLLGFKELYPAFCIHNGGSDLERLPSASTCMNLLKLPEFCDEHLMRNKLLYAIESSSGFELS
ncbi:UNVERIFIED_CONTAM: hypothetical protein FKN15_054862 [Acipenser sinensis]